MEFEKIRILLKEGKVEVHDVETALSFVKHLSEHGKPFNLKYNDCLLGEYWLFETEVSK